MSGAHSSSVRSLTWDEVRARRLARSHLLHRPSRDRLVDVVHDVGGIHAQVMAAAELSLSARVAHLTQQEVRAALWERRTLVKTWTLRGTLHLHAADELPLWLAARRAVTGWRDGTWHEEEGIERAQAEAVLAAIGEALDGRCLLREELADEVAARVGNWVREPLTSGWGYLIGPAVATGALCHGPPRGSKITFVRADQWVADWREVDLDDALAEVCRRYLATYGPARPEAFSQWFRSRSFKRADARVLFDSLRDELEEVDVDGRRASLLARDGDVPASSESVSVRLLPEYDAYLMAFREREQLVPEAAREHLFDHARGRYEGPSAVPWLLVDGVVRGWWSRKRRGKRLELVVEPFVRVTRSLREGIEAEAERIGGLLGLQAELKVG